LLHASNEVVEACEWITALYCYWSLYGRHAKNGEIFSTQFLFIYYSKCCQSWWSFHFAHHYTRKHVLHQQNDICSQAVTTDGVQVTRNAWTKPAKSREHHQVNPRANCNAGMHTPES